MSEKQFRPMLAETCEDMSAVRFPVMASPKLDGIRCVIRDGVPLSRKLKPIPNKHVCKVLSGLPPLDGEIMMRDDFTGKMLPFDKVQSAVMSHDGEPEIEYHVFDHYDHKPFQDRYKKADHIVSYHQVIKKATFLKIVEHKMIGSVQELLDFEERCIEQGYEGTMIRCPDGPYKFGRSTLKEGWLLKIKRWYDLEADLIGMVERQRNDNVAEVSELGLTKRAKKKEFLVPAGDMGALVLKYGGVQFECGTGFTAAQRVGMWGNRDELLEKKPKVTIKYQELTKDGVPRFPVFKGFRHNDDMS